MKDSHLRNIGTMPAEAASISKLAVPGSITPLASDVESDDEQALLCVVRLLNRSAISPGMSVVERAFLIGAKAMFEQLSKTCTDLIDEAESAESARPEAAPDEVPVAAKLEERAPRARRKA